MTRKQGKKLESMVQELQKYYSSITSEEEGGLNLYVTHNTYSYFAFGPDGETYIVNVHKVIEGDKK